MNEPSLLSEKAFRSLVQLQDEVFDANLSRLADIRRALMDLAKICDERIEELTGAIGVEVN